MKQNSRESKINAYNICIVAAFAVFGLLQFFAPLSGDDWFWGSKLGWNEFTVNHFANYNGRYLGDLFIIFVLRIPVILKAVMFSAIFVSIISLVCINFAKKSAGYFILTALLLFVMPRQMFSQTFTWASAFANYIVSALFMMVIFKLCTDCLFNSQNQSDSVVRYLLLTAAGFSAQLFVEHVTLFNICIVLLCLIINKAVFKKFSKSLVYLLIGTIAGAALMFSNSSYRGILNGAGLYQREVVGGGIASLVKQAIMFFANEISPLLVYKNTIITVAVLLVLMLVILKSEKRTPVKMLFSLAVLLVAAYTLAFPFLYSNAQYGHIGLLLNTALAVVYVALTVFVPFFFIEDKKCRQKIIFTAIAAVILWVPLVFVRPVGFRCFFPVNCFMAGYVLAAAVYLETTVKIKKSVSLILPFSACVTVLAASVFYLNIYIKTDRQITTRLEEIAQQSQEGKREIELDRLEYEDYFFYINPGKNPSYSSKVFNAYYAFPEDTGYLYR